jgi:N-acetylmuramoyl-L-alanine amidase
MQMGKRNIGSGRLQLRSLAAVSAILLMVTGLIFGASLVRRQLAGQQNQTALQTLGQAEESIRPAIVLDPGHGGMDGGAVGADGVVEKEVNLAIALPLRDMLAVMGYDVTMTRETDTDLGGSGSIREQKRADLAARLEIMEQDPDAWVLMIHQNQFTQPQYSGAQMWYGGKNTASKELAERLKESVVSLLQPDNTRECKPGTDDVWLLMQCGNPIVLVECGFLSNPEECAALQEADYQQKMAFAIAAGVVSG